MAFSKSQIPFTAQHYLVCGTEDCEKNCQFYCNDCHQPMCEQCRDVHQKSPDTKKHEVAPYQQRKRQLPEVNCHIHVNRYVDMLCEQCQVPVCSKCATKDHGGHTFIDLETVYAEKCAICLNEINKIEEYFLPTSQDLLKSTKNDSTEIKKIMESLRTSIRAQAESLKSMVDAVTSDNIKQVNEQEKSLLQLLNAQGKKYNHYISYINEHVKKFHGYLFSKNLQILMSEITKNLEIDPIPETTKPVPPVFTAGQYSKEDVTKLLGRVTVPDTKPEIREIKPMETVSTQLKPTEQQRKQDREKSDMKQTLSLSSSVAKVREYTVPGVNCVWHISLGKSGRVWGSDNNGNLVQTDLQGNQLQKIQTSGGSEGYHTVTQDGDLIFTDKHKKVIKRITQDNSMTEFIKTGDWEPISIHSSHINGDILVGMIKDGELAKVTRYNKTGEEIQNIQRDNIGQVLYRNPHYITENINGDICTSDNYKEAVVVVNKSGQYRFSYTGQGSLFFPNAICTDLLGHIIVCDGWSDTVNVVDQDGQFLSLLLTEQQGIMYPRSLCVDDENNLHVGQFNTSTVKVYKYLQ